MVDPLNVNRRSTEIPFPFFGLFIYFYIYFFHKKRNSKARGGGGGVRTHPPPLPPGYGPAIEIIFVAEKLRVNLFTDLYLVTPVFSQALTSLFLFSEAEGV